MKKRSEFVVATPDSFTRFYIPAKYKLVVSASSGIRAQFGTEVRFLSLYGGTLEFFPSEKREQLEVLNRAGAVQNIYVTYGK